MGGGRGLLQTLDKYGDKFAAGCFYDSECIKNQTWGGPSGGLGDRSWRYQKCREVAFLQSAPAGVSLRSRALTIDVLVEQCKYAFGGLTPTTDTVPPPPNGQPLSSANTHSTPASNRQPSSAQSVS